MVRRDQGGRERMRVALLVDSPSRRAHANAVSRLAIGLAARSDLEVELVCYSADPAPDWLTPTVVLRRLGVERVSRALVPLARYLREQQPDVLVSRQVHANFVALAAAFAARRGRGWRGRLVLVQDHPIALSHASNRRDNKWVAKAVYRFADGVVCPSPEVRAGTTSWCGLDPARVAVVPNPMPVGDGALPPVPHPWLGDDGPPVLVHTSNMTYWKRMDLLVDSFAAVRRHHSVRLLVVGEGPGRAEVDERLLRAGLTDCAQTVGWVEDPLAYAAHAWAFVLPSDEEGFAQVLTEAMSVGCPVVTTDAQGGGPSFVTQDGTYGMLVARGDGTALAAALTEMLRPEVRTKYARLGRERVEEFSPSASAAVLVDFLRERVGAG